MVLFAADTYTRHPFAPCLPCNAAMRSAAVYPVYKRRRRVTLLLCLRSAPSAAAVLPAAVFSGFLCLSRMVSFVFYHFFCHHAPLQDGTLLLPVVLYTTCHSLVRLYTCHEGPTAQGRDCCAAAPQCLRLCLPAGGTDAVPLRRLRRAALHLRHRTCCLHCCLTAHFTLPLPPACVLSTSACHCSSAG
jgi:hypothetical protein